MIQKQIELVHKLVYGIRHSISHPSTDGALPLVKVNDSTQKKYGLLFLINFTLARAERN